MLPERVTLVNVEPKEPYEKIMYRKTQWEYVQGEIRFSKHYIIHYV